MAGPSFGNIGILIANRGGVFVRKGGRSLIRKNTERAGNREIRRKRVLVVSVLAVHSGTGEKPLPPRIPLSEVWGGIGCGAGKNQKEGGPLRK